MAQLTQKELAKKKSMAKVLVESQGKDFDDWLAEQYDAVISENEDTIQKALNFYLERNKNTRIGG